MFFSLRSGLRYTHTGHILFYHLSSDYNYWKQINNKLVYYKKYYIQTIDYWFEIRIV